MKKRLMAVVTVMVLAMMAAWAWPTQRVVPVMLVWEPSPSTNVVGYAVYWGYSPRSYTNFVSVGPATNLTLKLPRGVTYYFAATAVDDMGLESDYSEECVWLAPPLGPLPPGATKAITWKDSLQ